MAKERSFEVTGTLAEDGITIIFDHANMLKKLLKTTFEGKKIAIKLEVARNNRSAAQNRYIHGCVVPCVQAWMKETTGEKKDHDEVYLWLRLSLIGDKAEVKDVMGQQVIVMTGKRFSQMTTIEFADAIDIIIKAMDERGCHIPLPKPKEGNYLTDFIKDE